MRLLIATAIMIFGIFLITEEYPILPVKNIVMVETNISSYTYNANHEDNIDECSQQDLCEWYLHSFAKKFNIDASTITKLSPDIISMNINGTRRIEITLPTGYNYCRSMLHLTNISPFKETVSSKFTALATPNGLSIDLRMPPLRTDIPNEWLTADITIIGVSTGYSGIYDKLCDRTNNSILLNK